MKILIIEDNVRVAEIADTLETCGHQTRKAYNLCDAESLLIDNQAVDPFDVVFLDLDMNIRDLPNEYREEARETYAGWVFYKYILADYPELQKKTIFFTAYSKTLEEKIGEDAFSKLNTLDKSSGNLIADIGKKLKALGSN